MNERDIFLAAIEITDPARRAAYVEQACGSDATLRVQVEELLKTHAQSSQFLETPALAAESAMAQTFVTAASHADEDPHVERASAEAEFRKYLQPATRTGWLGRLGHYEIEAILGRGAFGIVAKAFDEKLHRVVAIKLMNPELAATSPPRKRFLREARTAAAVTHENIVAIHAVEEEPIPYLVMEYIPGQTLQQWLDEHGPLEPAEILRIGRQVAAGLAAAHAANLIHRDIKPSNILMTGGAHERAKISDFGLARAVDDASMTQSGLIAGTPMYMAPEQAKGQTLDHRADLFSLGSVLYQMASGRPPFRAANTVAVLKRVCEDTPRPLDDVLPGIPGWLETIIFRLLEKDRDARYQTAQEVADLLARCQSEWQHQGQVTCVPGHPAAAETHVFPARTGNRSATGRWPIGWLAGGVMAGGVMAVVAVIGLVLSNGGRQKPEVSATKPPSAPVATTAQTPAEATAVAGWHGWPADAPPPAIAPFDAEQAKQHQEAWAKYLGAPVEYTNSLGMKFRLIPPGEFLMGGTPEEIAAALKDVGADNPWQEIIQSEAPQHKVILTQPIYLGVNEVTQAEYEKVMGANPSHFAPMGMGKEAVANLQTGSHPVEMVSWNDAAEFCAKLSQQEELKPFYFRAGETVTPLDGAGYRLPTEAEWEFACRAGTTTKFWIGDSDEDLIKAGWFIGNSGGRTHAAGELKANPFGLVDIHGNVWECVQDGWEATFYGQYAEKPAINPSSPFSAGSQRVLRGGFWSLAASACRSSFRNAGHPTHRRNHVGFRVSLVVDVVRRQSNSGSVAQTPASVPDAKGSAPGPAPTRTPWDDLDPAQIPEAERVPRQPEGLVAVLGQHRRRVWNILRSSSVSPDGTQFTLTTDDGLYLFGRDPKQPDRFFNLGVGPCSATYLPDGRIAAFVNDPGTQLQIFAKPRDGMPLEKLSAINTNTDPQIHYPKASADGRWLAAWEVPDNVALWKLGDAPPQRVAKFAVSASHGNIWLGSFSPDAHWFCFTDNSSLQSAVHLIDLRGDTPREATVLKADADENSDAPAKGFEHATFLSDGRLATADRNGRTWFWKINDGEPQRAGSIRDSGKIYPAAQSLRVAINIGGATFSFWDLAVDPPQLLNRASSSGFSQDNIETLCITPNGETVFTGHLNKAVRFWNTSQAGVTELDPLVPNPRVHSYEHQVKVIDHFLCASLESSRVGIWQPARDGLKALLDESQSLSILGGSPAQRQLIVIEKGGSGTALLRSEADRVTPTRRITGGNVQAAALNDEDRRLAVGRHNGTEHVVELWGWESDDVPARKLTEFKSPERILQLAFAEAGRTLLGRVGPRIQIWDVKDHQLITRTILPRPYILNQFAVAPDGQTLATVADNGLDLWNLKSDLTQPTTSFAIGGTGAVAFSPDGRRLAASFWEHGASAGVQIINLASGVVEKRLTFPGRVHELTFTDDSRHLITGNANATIYVVRLEQSKPPTTSTTSPVDFAQWVKQVASRSADGQAVEVVKKLRKLNPEFDGEVSHKVEKGAVTELGIQSVHLIDISPLRALSELKTLRLAGTSPNQIGQLVDLSPLAGMKLTSLDCSFTRVKDLSPLKGMKLTKLHCGNTDVDDLSPLAGMPLTDLVFGYTKVSDLSPLKGMPLTKLAFFSTPITDLSDLRGLPLTELVFFHNTRVTDLSPLEGMKLTVLDCFTTGVKDLSPLKGMPLTFLQCANTKVSDLSPLEGMPLTGLYCFSTQVEDLSPLKGMPLTSLMCERTRVNDDALKHLRELTKLETLNLTDTKVSAAGIASLRMALPNCKITAGQSPTDSPKPPLVATAPAVSPWDLLDAAQIPAAERVPEQPKELVAVLGEHRQRHAHGAVSGIAVRPDGKRFVTVGRDGMRFWDAGTFQELARVGLAERKSSLSYSSAAYISQGRKLVVGSEWSSGVVWQLDDSGLKVTSTESLPAGSSERMSGVSFIVSRDERWMIRRKDYFGKTHLSLFSLADDKYRIVAEYPDYQGADFSPDSRHLAICHGKDKTIHVLELGAGEPVERHVLKTSTEAVADQPALGFLHLAYVSDGRLATADNNGHTWFWNLQKDSDKPEFSGKGSDPQYPLHAARQAPVVECAGMVWSVDGTQARVKYQTLWGGYAHGESARPESNLTAFALLPDGKTVVTGHLNGSVRFWDLSGEALAERNPPVVQPLASPYVHLVQLPGVIATRDEQDHLRFWQPTANGLIEHPASQSDDFAKCLPLTASDDGKLLVTGSTSGPGCVIWNWDGEHLTPHLRVGRYGTRSAAFSSDGRRLAIGHHWEQGVDVWDITARPPRLERALPPPNNKTGGDQVMFLKGDSRLITKMGPTHTVWNLAEEQPVARPLLSNQAENSPLAYASTRNLLAMVASGTQLLTFEKSPPEPLFSLPLNLNDFGSATFSHDGSLLAVTDFRFADQTFLDVYNTETGLRKNRIPLQFSTRRMAFTADNRHLITANSNGTIYVLRLEPARAKPSSK